MKKLLSALGLALVLTAAAVAETRDSCGPSPASPIGTIIAGPCDWVRTAGAQSITMTLSAVNETTGLLDITATSVSEVILEYRECETCAPIRFPKPGDPPITNVGGGCVETDSNCAHPTRGFKLPGHLWEVRWNVLTRASGRLRGVVSFQ